MTIQHNDDSTKEEIRSAADRDNPSPLKQSGARRYIGAGVLLLGICLVTALVLAWWVRSRSRVTTDDAFIESHIHAVSSRIPGTVVRVCVNDNQQVNKGDTLVELDTTDYRVKSDAAAATLEMARNETSGEYAQLEAARAVTVQAAARLRQTELDLQRGEALFMKEVIPKEQLDRLQTAHRLAEAQLREAEERERRERAVIGLAGKGGTEARIAQKKAQFRESELNLSYTRIVSPAGGMITKKSVETGNIVQAGQPLMAVVTMDTPWITANYKEQQLAHVRPGQQVEFTVDGYPGRTFRGTVDSIMAGTGAAFSLLPPENATGNYVKVVQRVPVKIRIDREPDPDLPLRVGMSVVPTIITGRSAAEVLHGLNPFR